MYTDVRNVFVTKIDKLIDVFEYEEAVEWVRKGLKMSPNNMELLEKGGMVTLEVGLTDEAYTISAKREKDGGWYSGWERVIETGVSILRCVVCACTRTSTYNNYWRIK